jgi:tetratricopeptide (TPR) repeat protein
MSIKSFFAAILLISVVSTSFAQKAKVVSAFNYLKYEEYDKAKAAIDEAALDANSSKMYKTWYYRGMIYQAIHEKQLDSTLAPFSLDTAFRSYKQNLLIDPNNEFNAEAQQGLAYLGSEFYKVAYKHYSANDFSRSFDNFSKMLACDDVIRSVTKTYRQDTLIMYNAAITATKAKRTKEAIPYYNQLMDLKFKDAYIPLAQIYKELKDTTKALATIEQGLSIYKGDKDLLTFKSNIFISQQKLDEAINTIKEAIAADSKNIELQVILGSAYENTGKSELARAAFQNALTLDAENYDACEMMGISYYNEAAKLHNKMKDYTDMSKQKEYDALAIQRNEVFLKALPFLEKANATKPGHEDIEKMVKKIKAYTTK